MVQALDPDARSLRHAAHHDAEGFLAGELERRRALRYPPFSHLVRVVCAAAESGPERGAAAAVADRVRAALEARGGGAPEVLGPAALFRLKGRERAQVLVKSGSRAAAGAVVRRAVEAAASDRTHRGVAFSVDVDPL